MADTVNPASKSSEPVETHDNAPLQPTTPTQAVPPVAAAAPVSEAPSLQQVQDKTQAAFSQVGNVLNKAGQTLTHAPATPQAPTTMTERLWAALAYIPMVALISLLMNPVSAFVKLHAKQGLTLFIVFFLSLFLYIVFPPLGPLLGGLVQMAIFVVGIYSIYMAFSGNWWKIPFINQISDQLPVDLFTKVTTEAITGQAPSTQAAPTQAQTPPPEEKNPAPPKEPENPPVSPAAP